MTNFDKQVVAVLTDILPTYYELFLKPTSKSPCISYQQIQNTETAGGNTIGVSEIRYRIKLWVTDVADGVEYEAEIDDALATLHLHRTGYNELTQNDLICKIYDYSGVAIETYTTERT